MCSPGGLFTVKENKLKTKKTKRLNIRSLLVRIRFKLIYVPVVDVVSVFPSESGKRTQKEHLHHLMDLQGFVVPFSSPVMTL